jgi:hypothetical protein
MSEQQKSCNEWFQYWLENNHNMMTRICKDEYCKKTLESQFTSVVKKYKQFLQCQRDDDEELYKRLFCKHVDQKN